MLQNSFDFVENYQAWKRPWDILVPPETIGIVPQTLELPWNFLRPLETPLRSYGTPLRVPGTFRNPLVSPETPMKYPSALHEIDWDPLEMTLTSLRVSLETPWYLLIRPCNLPLLSPINAPGCWCHYSSSPLLSLIFRKLFWNSPETLMHIALYWHLPDLLVCLKHTGKKLIIRRQEMLLIDKSTDEICEKNVFW